MNLNCRFGVISDLHIATHQTVQNHPSRFHLVEVSIPVLERVLEYLQSLNLDFLLIPGDLTQHGEPENHQWLAERLTRLPFPVYVIPGNHDVPTLQATEQTIGLKDFPSYYQNFGYQNSQQLYYTKEIFPGLQLIALNSNSFDEEGRQLGCMDKEQFVWLEKTLESVREKLVLVTIHHNVIEHLPGQSQHPLGKRYMLANAPRLLQLLYEYEVKLIFTGHLHVQDIAEKSGIYEITTGSLVSYPHPYRIVQLQANGCGECQLKIESNRVKAVPGWENLAHISREWMGDRSYLFMLKLLTSPPLNLAVDEAEKYVPDLRYFWADIAEGDASFDFPHFPPKLRSYFQQFNAATPNNQLTLSDNQAHIVISH